MEDGSSGDDWPFWELIQGRWRTFLIEAGAGKRKGGSVAPTKPPCVACGETIEDFRDPVSSRAGQGNMVMIRRTKRISAFTQSEGLLVPFHPRCVAAARVRAEAEGLIWGDDIGE